MILKRLGVHPYTRPTDTPTIAEWRRWAHDNALGRDPEPEPVIVITPLVVNLVNARGVEAFTPTVTAVLDGLCAAGAIPKRDKIAALVVLAPNPVGKDGLRIEVLPRSRLRSLLG